MPSRDAILLPLKRTAYRAIHGSAATSTGVARWFAAFRTRNSQPAVFIWIPKSAGTSVWRLLAQNGGIQYFTYEQVRDVFPNQGIATFGHMNYASLLDDGLITDAYDGSAEKYVVVRNPFDRAVSLYLHLQRIGVVPEAMRFEMFTELVRQENFEKVGRSNRSGLIQCNCQISWLEHDPGLSSTVVGRFEDLDAFVNVLRSRLGISGSLSISNESPGRRHYRSYYSSRLARQNIQEYYLPDFEAFEYDF